MTAGGDGDGLTKSTQAFVEQVWATLAPEDRHLDGLNKRLIELRHAPISRASMYRWLKEKPVKSPNAKSGLPSSIVSETVKNVPVPNGPVNLDGIPVELVQAMGVRVLAIAKGEGLDKVEDAIVLVAGAIAGRAEDIAKGLLEPQTETETSEEKTRTDQSTAAMNAVNALGKLTDCLNRINASRVLWSMAHRNFAEGDLLSGQGRKYDAEAATILQEARANGARDITPTAPGDFDDAEAEDEAMAALRDVEGTK